MYFFIVLLMTAYQINAEEQCAPCYWNGQPFSCGAIAWFTSRYHACCDGAWCTCASSYPNGNCGCCGLFANKTIDSNDNNDSNDKPFIDSNVDNTPIDLSTYSKTEDNRLYTQFVTKAKFNKQTQMYEANGIAHSTDLQQGDLIMWDGKDVNRTGNVVMKLEHYAVDKKHKNCCASIKVAFPPSCQVKVCCGSGCCC